MSVRIGIGDGARARVLRLCARRPSDRLSDAPSTNMMRRRIALQGNELNSGLQWPDAAALTQRPTVSHVRVVTLGPKCFSINVMNIGVLAPGTYAVNTSRPTTARMRAPSTSIGSVRPPPCAVREKVTTRLALGATRNAA